MQVGLYGKLPSHGDFLRRRVSDAFVDAWDEWLQECMAASRAALEARWLDVYLTSPAWRFACEAGACGPQPIVGVMVPSVDRVGRYFPLTLVAALPPDANVVTAASAANPFFEQAERLLVSTLEAEHVDFESFDKQVATLAEALLPLWQPQPVVLDAAAAAVLERNSARCWQMPLGSADHVAHVLDQLLSRRLAAIYQPVGMWWTDGSANVRPTCLINRGLPDPLTFSGLLDGSFPEHHCGVVPARQHEGALDATTLMVPAAVRYRSAGATDVGKTRKVNQDAFLERADVGLWVVADGMGGHADGDVASRMVCDALADFDPSASFDEVVQQIRKRMEDVNEQLLRNAARSLLADRTGSTVVILVVRGERSAVMWAGDSRAYRLRRGKLKQLTNDHSAAAGAAGTRTDTNIITRAVGVAARLEIDVAWDRVVPGDRFLLCSDGLTRTVSDFQIQALIEKNEVEPAVRALLDASLQAGAPDNVTAVVVEAAGDESSSAIGSAR